MTVLPQEEVVTVCTLSDEQWLEAPQEESFNYTWYYYAEENSPPVEVGNAYRTKAEKTGYYQVQITYAQCAWTSDKKQVIFQEPTVLEEVANIFTPNKDGVNETFGIPLTNVVRYDLTIFNRQGKLVYHTDDPTDHWSGDNFPSGVYLWILHYQNPCDEEPTTKKGYISLTR